MFPVTMRGASTVKLWAHEHEVDPAALNQLRDIARLAPVNRVAVMPDVHPGTGATIGSVIAMTDAVSPSAVGTDIGCGVSAVRTSLTAADLPDSLGLLRAEIEKAIPVGSKMHPSAVSARALGIPSAPFESLWERRRALTMKLSSAVESKMSLQLGTLGGGNHFLEVCLDDKDCRVWLTLHSGSLGIGKELAKFHIDIAKALPHNDDIPNRDLAYFTGNTPEMRAYLHDLRWAQDYAALSRRTMMALFQRVVATAFPGTSFDTRIDAHHNYVENEVVDGQEFVVTRKGAIRAGSGDLALIPGSMSTGSYIVRGLGNPESLFSASHGAGRTMSRSAAKEAFTVDDLIAQTAGIECRKDSGMIDEIPGAYKSLDSVMQAQEALVSVVAHLDTVLCVKG